MDRLGVGSARPLPDAKRARLDAGTVGHIGFAGLKFEQEGRRRGTSSLWNLYQWFPAVLLSKLHF